MHFTDNTTLKFQTKTGEILEAEIIGNLNKKLKDEILRERFVSLIREATKKIWGDPRDAANKWVRLSNFVILVKDRGEIVGFVMAGNIDSNTIFFPATMIVAEMQSKGIAALMWAILLKKFYRERFKAIKWRLWKLFVPINFVFLTPNPRIYEIISRKIDLFPSIFRRKPTPLEINIAQQAAQLCSPGYNFNPTTFVNESVDLLHPDLMYDANKIPWAKDEKINKLFEENLQLTKKKGHNFVVVGKVTMLQVFLFYRFYCSNSIVKK